MKYLVTGATGYIGTQLAKQLAAAGHRVNALYRSESKTERLKCEGIELFKGDISDRASLDKAAHRCDGVFHVAAFAKPWAKDPQTFYRLNLNGAQNVVMAARNAGVSKVVFTSTAGVINPSNGTPSNEKTRREMAHFTHYEQSKEQAEEAALKLCREGMNIVTVNPSRVYGPGLLSDSNGVTRLIKMYLQGKFKMLPGDGSSIGNYVFIDDVVTGHILAMQKGKSGERYILGGDNVSFTEFFNLLSDLTGRDTHLYKIPIPVIKFVAKIMELKANLTGNPPILTPPWVKKYLYNWELSAEKAERELGYHPTPINEGLSKTIDWILQN